MALSKKIIHPQRISGREDAVQASTRLAHAGSETSYDENMGLSLIHIAEAWERRIITHELFTYNKEILSPDCRLVGDGHVHT